MPDKYSPAKAEQYGRQLASHLCDQYFATDATAALDGPGILGFTPVRQINLLVVRQLLHQWQAEVSRLRSPYFDFEAPAVQAALVDFQNVLSRYIKVGRRVFEPILSNAVTGTLRLAADPASAYEQFFLAQQPSITSTQLREGLRYLDINKAFFTGFLDTLPATGALTTETIKTSLVAYQHANYNQPQVVSALIAALTSLLPLTEADLREDAWAPAHTPSDTAKVAHVSPADEAHHAVAPALPTQAKTEKQPTATVPLHEKLKATQSAGAPLAAALRAAQPQPAALAERSAPKVESLRDAISINQRFSFINELFNGENMEYHATIQHLDSLNDLEEARLYITRQLAQRYDWSRKEEHVTKLLKLVERKLAPHHG